MLSSWGNEPCNSVANQYLVDIEVSCKQKLLLRCKALSRSVAKRNAIRSVVMGGMLREDLRALCSLPAALEAMGERWSFLILRGSFNGLHHFEEFQSELGIARNILANRLARLVDKDILERRPCPEDRRKIEYRLTDKGYALLPTMIALRQWGERWETGVPASPILVDARDMQPIAQ